PGPGSVDADVVGGFLVGPVLEDAGDRYAVGVHLDAHTVDLGDDLSDESGRDVALDTPADPVGDLDVGQGRRDDTVDAVTELDPGDVVLVGVGSEHRVSRACVH